MMDEFASAVRIFHSRGGLEKGQMGAGAVYSGEKLSTPSTTGLDAGARGLVERLEGRAR